MTDPIEQLRAWCKTDSREPPIEEICEAIEAYDALKTRCSNLERERDCLNADIAESNRQRDQARADMAAMTKLYSDLGEKHEGALLDIQKWQTLNRHAIEDSCDDDTKIRDLCRPFLTEKTCDHDGYAVVPIVDVVKNTIAALETVTAGGKA